jgi:hypothetical protein
MMVLFRRSGEPAPDSLSDAESSFDALTGIEDVNGDVRGEPVNDLLPLAGGGLEELNPLLLRLLFPRGDIIGDLLWVACPRPPSTGGTVTVASVTMIFAPNVAAPLPAVDCFPGSGSLLLALMLLFML